MGRDNTLDHIRKRFYWPGMSFDVERWGQNCTVCTRRKPGLGKYPMQHCLHTDPYIVLQSNITGPLPMTEKQNEYIMVIGDYFTKWKEAFALQDHTAQTVADVLITEFICRYGTPYRIHTDQGREFESQLFSEIGTKLEIYKTRITIYRPPSDGMVERLNRTLQQMRSLSVNKHRTDWDDHLPYVMMAYSAAIHDSTKCSQHFLMLGRETEFPIDIFAGNQPNYEEDICINMLSL